MLFKMREKNASLLKNVLSFSFFYSLVKDILYGQMFYLL